LSSESLLVNQQACLCHHHQKNDAIILESIFGDDLKLVFTELSSISYDIKEISTHSILLKNSEIKPVNSLSLLLVLEKILFGTIAQDIFQFSDIFK
jgi:hypothetical protein